MRESESLIPDNCGQVQIRGLLDVSMEGGTTAL